MSGGSDEPAKSEENLKQEVKKERVFDSEGEEEPYVDAENPTDEQQAERAKFMLASIQRDLARETAETEKRDAERRARGEYVEEYEEYNPYTTSYTPSTLDKSSDEYVPACAVNMSSVSDEYVPAVIDESEKFEMKESNAKTPRACDQILDKNADSSSDSDGEYEKMIAEFRPKVEKVRKEPILTEEEKACAAPAGKHESKLPPAVDVSSFELPAQVNLKTLGKITSIMYEPTIMIVIQSAQLDKPLNQDSMIFKSDRTAIGLLFETFGPVKCPFYSVRFNTKEHLDKLHLQKADEIFYVDEFSFPIQVEMLKRQKGTDASWQDDDECPNKYQDFSDDEAEKEAARALKKSRQEARESTRESEGLPAKKKKETEPNTTVYICGLAVDFRESTIKELFSGVGVNVKRVKLLRTPNGETRCAAVVNLRSSKDAFKSIEKLNMKITLPGAEMPLAVKMYEERQKKNTFVGDLDKPSEEGYKVTFASNRSTILRGTKRAYAVGAEKEAKTTTQHTLHSLQPDTDGVIGVDHAFVKKHEPSNYSTSKSSSPRASIVLTGGIAKKDSESATKAKTQTEDVFSWGASVSDSTKHVYAPKRSLPPELLNPEAHPSPYEDPKKKKCNPIGGQQALKTGSSGGLIAGATSSNTGIVSHLYESSGDEFSETEDVENPNYSAFCQGLQVSSICVI